MPAKFQTQPEVKHVAELIAAAKQDLRMFGELYLLYVQPVFQYLFSRIGNLADAEDITAQTFLAALERFPSYRHNGFFASWLFAIARNKAMDYFRKQRKEAILDQAETIPADTNFLQETIKTERLFTLSKLIRALPEEEQELIRLRYVAELSFAEIGHLLDQKEETVKKRLYRLLRRLKDQADEYLTENNHV